MPNPGTPEDVQRKIIEMWKDPEIEYKKTIANEVGVSRATVNKYIDKYQEGELSFAWDDSPDDGGSRSAAQEFVEGEDGDDDTPEGWTADPPPETAEELGDDRPDFENMSPGSFVKWFFDQDGFGVRGKFVNRLASVCDVRDEVPDQHEMANNILEGNSGINSSYDAKMVAESYGAALSNYRQANGMDGGRQPGAMGGSWVGPDGGGQQQQQASPGGSWVGFGDDDGSQGQQAHARRAPQRQQQAQQQAPQQQQTPRGGRDDKIEEAISELKNTQRRIMQQMSQDNSQDRTQSLKEQVEEIAEINRTLEGLQGGDGDSDEVQALRQQISELQNELHRQEQQPQQQPQGGGEMTQLAQLAAQDDIDSDTLSVLAETMGVTDPEVKKAEYDFEKAKMKMQNRQEMLDGIFENLEGFSGGLINTALDQLASDDDDGDAPQATAQRPPDQGGGAAAEIADRGNSSPNRDGEIQVVGENTTADEQRPSGGGGNVSPAREMYGDDNDAGGGSLDDRGFSINEGTPVKDDGGCQWTEGPNQTCGDPTLPNDTLCEKHRDIADGEGV